MNAQPLEERATPDITGLEALYILLFLTFIYYCYRNEEIEYNAGGGGSWAMGMWPVARGIKFSTNFMCCLIGLKFVVH